MPGTVRNAISQPDNAFAIPECRVGVMVLPSGVYVVLKLWQPRRIVCGTPNLPRGWS